MADDALTDAITEALGIHRLHASLNTCTGCTWRATPNAGSLLHQHEQHRAGQVAQVVREHTAAQVAAAERDRDEWRARRDLAIETCRFRHQDGLTAEEWHTRICGAMQGAQRERARAERAEAQVAAAKAEGWAACVLEAEDLGWMHDLAAADMAGRNPYITEEQR